MNLLRYGKFVAALGNVGAAFGAIVSTGFSHATTTEWSLLGSSIAVAIGVWAWPNVDPNSVGTGAGTGASLD